VLASGSTNSVSRGYDYFRRRRAAIISADDLDVIVHVQGTADEPYVVRIWLDADQPHKYIHAECDCPYAESSPLTICKHKVAALLEMEKHFRENGESNWKHVMEDILASPAPAARPQGKNLLVFSVQNYSGSASAAAYSVPTAKFPPEALDDLEAAAEFIENSDVARDAKRLFNRLNIKSFLNVKPGQIAAANLLVASTRSYYELDPSAAVIYPLISEGLVYQGTYQDPFQRRLQIRTEPAKLEIQVENKGAELVLHPMIDLGDKKVPITRHSVAITSNQPLWAIVEGTLLPIAASYDALISLIRAPKIVIPEQDTDYCFEEVIPRLAEQMRVDGEGIGKWVEVRAEPMPRVYLKESQGALAAELRFGYSGYEVSYNASLPETSVKRDREQGVLVRILRDQEAEQSIWKSMSSYGLKRAQIGAGFSLRQNTTVVDFLIHHVPKLTHSGFEVYGEESLKSVKVNRSKPKISISVSSGIDWFDLQTVVNFGDIEVSISEIRKAVKKRERYVKLADGSIGEIPEEWIERYKHLFDLSHETDDGLRLDASQITLLGQLINDVDSAKLDDDLERKLSKLRDFSQIEHRELPRGFIGEMRGYQKAGYDWLHFLHEYEFGGCLADDMGIGKTVQTLVFLLSLRESDHAKAADLIVMPRSLLTNWAREVEKFTPGLKVLIYADLDRPKNVSEFDGYDLILTTYGIMRRDHAILTHYRFHYVVLDESQSVKNPLALTARSARGLHCDHRLVLTGTPVENSTVELWSQFAFLNPGMFGSLERFKTEFAGPIERKQDDEAARQLRGLVYPFILRRTKEQVAKELPPRTERIVYCEMDADQKRTYDQWRDQYRALLLGMIEDKGVAKSKMKVLEGLLRLRQIANHPKLVEKDYKGEAAKMEVLVETLQTLHSEGHKALVFSQFTQMLRIIRSGLDELNIPYTYLDGHTRDRDSRVDTFQNDPAVPFFLISLKAGGVGLNLTAADYVIHVDPWWNPAVERQASDRTHRIGQDKPVFVHKLIVRDTVEEKMLELQDRKKDLVDQLISVESGMLKSLTAEDVAMLFG
jgi:non-specific serine/threonine protein kinase